MTDRIKDLDKKRLLTQGMKLLTLFILLSVAFLLYRNKTTLAAIVGGIALLCFALGYLPERREYKRLWEKGHMESAYALYLDAPTLERKPAFTGAAFRALQLFPCADMGKGFLLRNRVSGRHNGLPVSLTDVTCPVSGANGKLRFLVGCLMDVELAAPAPWRLRCAGSAIMSQEAYSAYYTGECGLEAVPHEESGMPQGTALYMAEGPLPEAVSASVKALMDKCGGNAVLSLEGNVLRVFIQHRFSLLRTPEERITQEKLTAPAVPELPEVLAVGACIN